MTHITFDNSVFVSHVRRLFFTSLFEELSFVCRLFVCVCFFPPMFNFSLWRKNVVFAVMAFHLDEDDVTGRWLTKFRVTTSRRRRRPIRVKKATGAFHLLAGTWASRRERRTITRKQRFAASEVVK